MRRRGRQRIGRPAVLKHRRVLVAHLEAKLREAHALRGGARQAQAVPAAEAAEPGQRPQLALRSHGRHAHQRRALRARACHVSTDENDVAME